MKIEIKNRFDFSIIFECEADSLRIAVELAVKQKINLSYADLRSANLSYADLRSADLRYADLRSANLSSADLRSANLSSADLSYADLRSADLRSANLSSADLRSANLSYADLSSANLSYADLRSAKNMSKDTIIDTGETWGEYLDNVVPELLKAGGHAVTPTAWQCHSWENCPMAEAFGVHDLTKIPVLLRPRAEQFIRFFDAGMIPLPDFLKPQEAVNP